MKIKNTILTMVFAAPIAFATLGESYGADVAMKSEVKKLKSHYDDNFPLNIPEYDKKYAERKKAVREKFTDYEKGLMNNMHSILNKNISPAAKVSEILSVKSSLEFGEKTKELRKYIDGFAAIVTILEVEDMDHRVQILRDMSGLQAVIYILATMPYQGDFEYYKLMYDVIKNGDFK